MRVLGVVPASLLVLGLMAGPRSGAPGVVGPTPERSAYTPGDTTPAAPDTVPEPPPAAPVPADSSAIHPDSARAVPDTFPVPPATVPLPDSSAAPTDTLRGRDTTSAGADTTAAHAGGIPAPKWALVLSGGVARGIAHVGVLKRLEAEHLRPDLVVGSSMGALVAALYASGMSSSAIESTLVHTDWNAVLDAGDHTYGWRGAVVPRPWLRFESLSGRMGMPRGLLDDSYLNYALSASLLDGEALAGGDFSKLPVPLRMVATDLQTTFPVVLDHGPLAQAVRSSISVPVFFPPVPFENRILGDGGSGSNLPAGTARAAGIDRIFAVDVAIPSPTLDENSSAARVGIHLFDMLNKRGQIADTLSARDTLLWLKLPGYSMWGFDDARRLVTEGFDGSRDAVRRYAASAGLPHTDSTLAPGVPCPMLPPLAPVITWHDRSGKPAGRAQTARAALGNLPAGRFAPHALGPALERLYRANLFESAWPRFVSQGDSTRLDFEVREYPGRALDLTAGYEFDRGVRGLGALQFRPLTGPLPALMVVAGRFDQFGARLNLAAESTPLARGASGWFARGMAARTDTRVFESDHDFHRVRTERQEILAGLQRSLPWGALVQAGAGFGHVDTDPDHRRQGFMIAARSDQHGRIDRRFEITAIPGKEGYGVVTGVAGATIPLPYGPVSLRPSARAGLASRETPIDELPGLGGPETLAGLKYQEWLGREMLGFELRLIWRPTEAVDLHAFGQAGGIGDAVSREDLTGSPRFATGFGARIGTPFGPLRIDWGFADTGQNRTDFSFGPDF